jgi:hypothetical protein
MTGMPSSHPDRSAPQSKAHFFLPGNVKSISLRADDVSHRLVLENLSLVPRAQNNSRSDGVACLCANRLYGARAGWSKGSFSKMAVGSWRSLF